MSCSAKTAAANTLIQILAGVQTATTGSIRFRGQPIELQGVHHARTLGISAGDEDGAEIHPVLNESDRRAAYSRGHRRSASAVRDAPAASGQLRKSGPSPHFQQDAPQRSVSNWAGWYSDARYHALTSRFETSALNHSASFDQRRRPETLRTAIATAFFWQAAI